MQAGIIGLSYRAFQTNTKMPSPNLRHVLSRMTAPALALSGLGECGAFDPLQVFLMQEDPGSRQDLVAISKGETVLIGMAKVIEPNDLALVTLERLVTSIQVKLSALRDVDEQDGVLHDTGQFPRPTVSCRQRRRDNDSRSRISPAFP